MRKCKFSSTLFMLACLTMASAFLLTQEGLSVSAAATQSSPNTTVYYWKQNWPFKIPKLGSNYVYSPTQNGVMRKVIPKPFFCFNSFQQLKSYLPVQIQQVNFFFPEDAFSPGRLYCCSVSFANRLLPDCPTVCKSWHICPNTKRSPP